MRTFLFGVTLALAALGACQRDNTTVEKAAQLPTMTVDEVDRAITAKTAVAIDCNVDRTRKKHGILPGAVLITDEENYAPAELPADKTTKLVFYCSEFG